MKFCQQSVNVSSIDQLTNANSQLINWSLIKSWNESYQNYMQMDLIHFGTVAKQWIFFSVWVGLFFLCHHCQRKNLNFLDSVIFRAPISILISRKEDRHLLSWIRENVRVKSSFACRQTHIANIKTNRYLHI